MIHHEPSLAAVLWGARLSLAGWVENKCRKEKKKICWDVICDSDTAEGEYCTLDDQ